jgi:hypothetical protein
MKTSWILALLLPILCGCSRGPKIAASHNQPNPQRVRDQLASTTIRDVRLNNVPHADAVAFWMKATQENDPQHRGVSCVFAGDTHTHVTVDIVTNSVSALDLLNDICRQADLVWSLTPGCMVIRPANQPGAGPESVKGGAPW